jgi:hypothetical protein
VRVCIRGFELKTFHCEVCKLMVRLGRAASKVRLWLQGTLMVMRYVNGDKAHYWLQGTLMVTRYANGDKVRLW